ncbi:collagenase [Undibacterium sp.]|uniref:collagenase n=1 Tax=Undibacterium sp. TaxID=1914977 RepID=UPI003751FBBD
MKTSHTSQVSTRWAISAVSLAISFVAGTAFAGATHTTQDLRTEQAKRIGKVASTEAQLVGEHRQQKSFSAAERKPSAPPQLNAKLQYGGNENTAKQLINRPSSVKKSASSRSLTTAAACDTQLFATSSGTALVNAVKASTTDCLNGLYSVTGTSAGQIFNEAKMITIADAFRASSASYNGTNSGSTLQLVMFLRAGYYVNYYYGADTGAYGNNLKTSIRGALDAFANNGNFGLVNDAHGETLAEVITLIDSSTENARYLNTAIKPLLTNYNSSYNASWWMKGAVNNSFTVLFRGHQNADFKTLVQSDPSIIDTLYNFVNANFSQLGTDTGYLMANAGRELGRFLQYPESGSLKSLAKSRAKLLIDRSSITGSTAKLWIGVGEMIVYYDKANCSYYSLCDFQTRVETTILPIKHSCSPTLRIRAQSMTPAQLTETCNIQAGQESYFHQELATNKVPVANDNNTQLEMNVFASSDDYGTYGGAIFGIDTNNGGMYLEGDPSVVGNQARFIAYQAEWLLPKFEIWNLTHEYVHYLDGRFNIYGDFGAAMGVSSVWWIEGFAEYMSYSYRNIGYDGAKQQAALGTYNLSTIFKNDYNSGQTRVYNWGYLAVRYMFEKQRAKVNTVLSNFRPGNWTGYTSYMNGASMSNSMDTSFKAWLPCVNNPSAAGCTGTPPTNVLPVASFNNTVSNLSVNFSDTSTDSDGSIASRSWNFGDGTTSTAANPAKTYSASGTYNVVLTVTDNSGGTASTNKSITVTASNVLPVAGFTNTVSNLSVNFTDTSTDSDGSIASRSWRFGDGTTSTVANPSKTYSAAGTYNVVLTVTDNLGGTASTNKSITVTAGSSNALPVANFTSGVTGLTAYFTDSSTDSDGTIASRLWNFGDGTTSSLVNPAKTYAVAGTYTVTLRVTDNQGAQATRTATVTVVATGSAECTDANKQALGKNCTRSNLSGAAGSLNYMYLYVPAGTTKIVLTSSGGTGNANMYANTLGNWATNTSYNYRSTNAGNSETITINNPPANTYIYVSLHGATAYSGVQVKATY